MAHYYFDLHDSYQLIIDEFGWIIVDRERFDFSQRGDGAAVPTDQFSLWQIAPNVPPAIQELQRPILGCMANQ